MGCLYQTHDEAVTTFLSIHNRITIEPWGHPIRKNETRQPMVLATVLAETHLARVYHW